MSHRFSVIMPLYNKAPYVRKALESVLSQTFKDFELIVVDDGSTDDSVKIAEEYLLTPYTLHLTPYTIIRQANAGVAAARNNGVFASNGQFLCFLDADDWWEPNFLEEMDRLITEYPDAGIFCTNYIYYKPGKTHVAIKHPTGYMNYPEAYLHGEMPVWTGAACMSRKVFDEMGGFPVGIKLGEDFLLWAKIALKYKVAFCEKPLAYYNNDIPATMRATRNLHAPQYHMLFNMNDIEWRVESGEWRVEWKALLDKLRVSGLMEYWLSDEYHDAAAEELKKVDWIQQPKSVKKQYKKPIWILKAKRKFMRVGSLCKQKLIRLCKVLKLS